MTTQQKAVNTDRAVAVEIYNADMDMRTVQVPGSPTAAQIAAAAGYDDAKGVVVLQLLSNGCKDLAPHDPCDLSLSKRFAVISSDRMFFLEMDGNRFAWSGPVVTGHIIRPLCSVPEDKAIFLVREGERDREIGDDDKVRLDRLGVEVLRTSPRIWKINVQGTILDVASPTIKAREAMSETGIDVSKAWHIYLIVKDQPKREIDIDDTIDLRTPGIEKLRLTPKDVSNGEAANPPRRDFKLLPQDHAYLDALGMRWETLNDPTGRFLVIYGFPVPHGYNFKTVTLALLIPPTYPNAQIDMFYTLPPLELTSGRVIECKTQIATVGGVHFNGWSRHRGAAHPWNPTTDNVRTQLALVESSLCKEVGL